MRTFIFSPVAGVSDVTRLLAAAFAMLRRVHDVAAAVRLLPEKLLLEKYQLRFAPKKVPKLAPTELLLLE
jgi:hypothetical protein